VAVITDYASLKTAVSDYLARSDLSGFTPNFVQNCESTLYKSLRIRAMENALNVTIASGVAAVPTSPVYVELKYAYVDVSPVQSLDRVPPDQVFAMYPVRSGAEIPSVIAVDGSNFIFGPYPGNYTVKGIYYGRLAALSDSNTTNWFTSYAPDLLLYGSLLEAEPFLKNDRRIPVWQAFYQRAYEAVQNEERRQRSSGGNIAMRLA
jgi:hypothetical protein